MSIQLRDYQNDASNAVFKSFEVGKNALIVAATGVGKTVIFSDITQKLVTKHKRVLILAHRSELLEQTRDKLLKFGVMSVLEQAENTASLYDNVVVASIKSIYKEERLHRFAKDHFDVIIVDECHHILADTYQRVINYFDSALILGVTATPNRSDMRSLSKVFPEVSFSYDTRTAIDDGFLVPVNIKRLPIEIDISEVRTVTGDYNLSDLENTLDPYLEKIAAVLKSEAENKKTLIFTPTIDIAEKMANILVNEGFRAAAVHSRTKNRKEQLEKFATGELTVVVNPMILTEGFDEPSVDCIVNLRATTSESLYRQILGRGLRLSPNKENLLYLDFLWNTAKKRKVLNPASILIDEENIKYLKDKDLDEEIDIFELEEILAQRRAKAEERLAEKLRKAARARYFTNGTRMTVGEIEDENISYLYEESGDSLILSSVIYKNDPCVKFILGNKSFEFIPIYEHDCDLVTPKQKEMLSKIGIAHPELIQFKGQASILIDAAIKRRDKNLCSFKQYIQLDRRGFKNVRNWTPEQCSYVIGAIAKNNWKVPRQFYPIPKYKPAKEVAV